MDEGEVTMICIDTFDWMKDPKKSCGFHDQIDAAEIYCERKLKAHPDNLVGIVTFGTVVSDVALYPTNDLQSIRDRLASLGTYSHFPNLIKGIQLCRAGCPLFHARSKVIPVVVNLLKESRAVVDVVNFGYRIKGWLKDDKYKQRDENLKALVDAVNDYNKVNGDSRYFHIQDDGFSLTHHISTSPILPLSPSPPLVAEEEEARIIRRKAKIYPAILPPPSLVAEEEEEDLPPYHRDWWVEVVDSGW
ncbi:26S proteasome non-ATPase regulatory subunit 4 [Tanacetum coccineum]